MSWHSDDTRGSLLRSTVLIPTREEDLALITRSQGGDIQSRNNLLLRHMPGMLVFAADYYRRIRRPRYVDMEDVAHICVIGFARAIAKFNPKKTTGRLLGYAKFWMRDCCDKALNEYQLFRIPLSTLKSQACGARKNAETARAIEFYRPMKLFGQEIRILDHRLTPDEEATLTEEIQRFADGPKT